jgi:hypothetical protein
MDPKPRDFLGALLLAVVLIALVAIIVGGSIHA